MNAILLLLAMSATVPGLPMSPETAKQHWQTVTHMCWEGTSLDGEPISETEMKVACITAGVLTAHLVDAGYCLHPRDAEWKPCK